MASTDMGVGHIRLFLRLGCSGSGSTFVTFPLATNQSITSKFPYGLLGKMDQDIAGSQVHLGQRLLDFSIANYPALPTSESHQDALLLSYKYRLWTDSLLFPLYFAAISFVVVVGQLTLHIPTVKRWRRSRHQTTTEEEEPRPSRPQEPTSSYGFLDETREHIRRSGGMALFMFKATRLVISLALLGLSIYASIITEEHDTSPKVSFEVSTWIDGRKKHKKKHRKDHWFSIAEWLQLAQCAFFTYSSLLALLSISVRPRLTKIFTRHLNAVLLVCFSVFAYRDLYPFATFDETPLDGALGWVTWSKVSLLFVGGMLIPLIVPRVHEPVDPKNPLPPNPEQTASILSFFLFSFLDSIVWLAYRSPHLEYDSLPILADHDHADHLVKRAFPHLDPFQKPVKKSHLFWGLLRIFWKDYSLMAMNMVIKVFASFAGPVGIYHLLEYMEKGGEGAKIRPWVWIIALFAGPMIGSVVIQWYIWINNRILVQVEAIITQLVFEHSLRIRLTEDIPSSTTSSSNGTREATLAQTPETIHATLPEVSTAGGQEASGGSDSGGTTIRAPSSPGGADSKQSQLPTSGKAEPRAAPIPPQVATLDKKGANLVGKITNLISTDLGNIVEGRNFLWLILYCPFQIAVGMWYLYTILGWSAIVGVATMVVSMPIPGKVAQLISVVQVARMKRTDARVQSITETMNVIRMIKLFGWENKFKKQISKTREEELQWFKKSQILTLVNMNINHALPLITMILTFATYTLIMKGELTPSKIFTVIAVFDILREHLHSVFFLLPVVIRAKVSLDRVSEFTHETELLDRFADCTRKDVALTALPPTVDPNTIGFRNCTFSWRTDSAIISGASTPSRRNFQLHIEGDLFFQKGKINMIIGPTGCGKTSTIMALLGEMHFLPKGIDSWFNLPREGGVAYAAQEGWVQNETIKENILFGSPYDEERYNKVIEQCALKRDLSLFEAGDATEVGEKGMTLSGGQKARVTLARAIYSRAEIILLDDVLSALDVHTSRWVVDECFKGDLVQGRTIILVTHNIAMVSPIADFVVSLGLNGRVVSQGSVSEALSKDPLLLAEVAAVNQANENEQKTVDTEGKDPVKGAKPSGKLVVKEEIVEGRIGMSAFKLFLGSFGGAGFWITFFVALTLTEFTNIFQTWWLGHWGKAYQDHPASEVDVSYYLGAYGLMIAVGMIGYSLGFAFYVFGSIRASRKIHNKLVNSIMGTTLRWLDSTPTGRIVARFTQDIRSIDGPVSSLLQDLSELIMSSVLKLGAIVLYSPIFAVPGLFVAIIGAWIGKVYMAAQLSVKREMSNARSPLYSYLNATIAGLISIRAYGAEQAVKLESQKRIDHYTRPARTFYNLNRWICIRIDALGGLFAASLAYYLVYVKEGMEASNTGFSLTISISFSAMLLWIVRMYNNFEVQGNSLERIEGYLKIEQEPASTEVGKPPAYWPSSGALKVKNLSARYSPDGPEVLHNISFEIRSGEKVGIVGRTGAGKSSLSLALLRMIPTTGHVYYDYIATDGINLRDLRNNITIIPQQPELMSGTLRQNLDPFEEHDDAILNDALRSAGMFNLQVDDAENQIRLDTMVSSGGANFSVGQRQIIALARAMVRRSKMLILDEATASVDYETDTAIQNVISSEFSEVTLIIVAHRLQTIMRVDKILVLDAGRVVEFDSPKGLLERPTSAFKAMVDGSGDREALYNMVQ